MGSYVPRTRETKPDPTPEQIRERAERIRQTWSAHEQERRSASKTHHWLPPVLAATEVPAHLTFESEFSGH